MSRATDRRTLVERYALPPAAIEAASLRHVDPVLEQHPMAARWGAAERAVARRMIYAAGDLSLADAVAIHPEAIVCGLAALQAGRPLVVDVRMVAVALDRARLEWLGCAVHCAIDAPDVVDQAAQRGLPRAVVAMRALAGAADGAIVVVGTAPTALLALLDLVDAAQVRPALIVGTPVGFSAAAESKAELAARDIPFITVLGTRGGAALAAAATNALLRLARHEAS